MKKHSSIGLQAVKACGLALFLSLAVLFSACKTVPETSAVNPLDTMDSGSSFYLRISASTDPVLLERILKGQFKGISDSNAKKVIEHIDTVYIGLNRSRHGVDFQLAVGCNFPQVYIKSAFTKKNGWTGEDLVLDGSDGKAKKYTVYQSSNLLASFPSENVACFGRNVPAMVERYHLAAEGKNVSETEGSLDGQVYSWLSYEDGIPDNEIHFYANRPQSFLTTLTGAQLNYQLSYVRGRMYNDPKNDRQFIMQLEFDFKDRRVVQAAKGALSLAFGLADSEITRESDTHLTVSNIKISKKQLYSILVL